MTIRPSALSRRDFVQKLTLAAVLFAVPTDLRLHPPARAHRGRRHHGLDHPDARSGITSEHVLSNDALKSSKPDVIAAYDGARKHPVVFDSIACGCSCGDQGGAHRSLLVCYETQQPTGCWSCQKEARLVAELADKSTPLAEIRAAVDKKFG
jgi:hypothetical protein